jgi:hypothetical protein
MIHPQHRIRSALALTLALTACAAAPAAARPQPTPGPPATTQSQGSTNLCSEVCGGNGYKSAPQHSTTVAQHGATLPHDSRPHPIAATPEATSSDNGFDWGDAGVGAGGTVVVLLLAAGGVYVVTTRRGRHAGEAA